ncbi:MAG: DsrE family protein [Natronospirillum sp.]|uniref:DsrE/DsrF/TusD sulfur relay family protein n=1 Tax=Natronospirillum sp. TaxID=2812955 RepID=UPI0025EBC5A4|nr:DsrE family protein [Natronospirillum sp.]MCH8552390.1 DsrE family protein [Natronospirillum sp.]
MKPTQAMTFALTVTASPFVTDQHQRALRLAQAMLRAGHQLTQVFFYQDGVQAARAESPLTARWAELAAQSGCPLYVCVSAAERRGVEAPGTPWQIVGLGDWLAGCEEADRHLHFGD